MSSSANYVSVPTPSRRSASLRMRPTEWWQHRFGRWPPVHGWARMWPLVCTARLAVCWQLAQHHGLAIATLMQAAQRDIVERDRFSARVAAGMTGARTTAAVLAGLPLLGVGLGEVIGAGPVRFLLSDGAGGGLLIIGVTLACAGLLWSDRITAGVLT
jgi:Flp pilus assembly protein TadB